MARLSSGSVSRSPSRASTAPVLEDHDAVAQLSRELARENAGTLKMGIPR
ncbi:hypothetical protein [Actinomadura verrucosospora]